MFGKEAWTLKTDKDLTNVVISENLEKRKSYTLTLHPSLRGPEEPYDLWYRGKRASAIMIFGTLQILKHQSL